MYATKKKSVKAGKFVDTAHVNTLVRNYKKDRWVRNSKALGKEDSLSVWYSIEELESFLAKAKESGADGIRMFFGEYDKDFAAVPEYAGRQTIVMVATRNKENENGIVRKEVYTNTENGPTVVAYNLGSLCPPWCNGGLGNDGEPPIGVTIVDKGEDGIVVA